MLAIIAYSLALAVAGAPAPAPGPCDLLDKAAAGQVLGTAVSSVTPSGPDKDDETGASRTTCIYKAGDRMLLVMRLDFPTAAAARDAANEQLQGEALTEEGTTVKEEPGIGDKAWLAHTKHALQYIVVKGPAVLSLLLGGMPKDLSTYESQLRTATTAALKKL